MQPVQLYLAFIRRVLNLVTYCIISVDSISLSDRRVVFIEKDRISKNRMTIRDLISIL